MAKDQRNVEAITPMEVDFAKWFTDVCTKAELVDYSDVKGLFVLRPYGYAIWENIQKVLDGKFKATGHQNVSMPMLIPESLLQKEKDHVEGFAPECAWVTMGGSDKLEERLAHFDAQLTDASRRRDEQRRELEQIQARSAQTEADTAAGIMFNRLGNLRRFAFVKLVNRTSRVGRGGNHIKPGIVQLILPLRPVFRRVGQQTLHRV